MKSTQRVKGAHGVIKKEGSGSATLVPDVLQTILDRITEEKLQQLRIQMEDQMRQRTYTIMADDYFPNVVSINAKYLGCFGREKMEDAMNETSHYKADPDEEDAEADEDGDEGKDEQISKAKDVKSQLEFTDSESESESEDDDAGDSDYVPDAEHLATVKEKIESSLETSKADLKRYLKKIGADNIVAILKRRWFCEEKQDDESLEEEISTLPFVQSMCFVKSKSKKQKLPVPRSTYLTQFKRLLPSKDLPPLSSKPVTPQKTRRSVPEGP
ncbi:hypothetical protein BGZ52_005859 [Haplosporangium bisporale]|nr:hypothetical protein BGZ52_005859 [Haplosporangium bisporale]